MSRRKKLLVAALLVLMGASVAGYVVLQVALERASRRALEQLIARAQQQGVAVQKLDFRSVRPSGWIAATWRQLQAVVSLHRDEPSRHQWWSVHAARTRMRWTLSGRTTLNMDRVVMDGGPAGEATDGSPVVTGASDRRVELNQVVCRFEMDPRHPIDALQRLVAEGTRLATGAATGIDLELTGTMSFPLRGQTATLRLRPRRRPDGTGLVLEAQDVSRLSAQFDEELTLAEAELIAQHPLKAIRLLQIKDRAESQSMQAHRDDPAVPEDAYRHVLWSYLLTGAFEADFARQVGDAHETGNTGNTEAERRMDLHNNAIGRQYAVEGLAESDVLPRVLQDPNVIRVP